MIDSNISAEILLQDILLQSNTLSEPMIIELEKMFSSLELKILQKLYYEIFCDVDNINKIKSGVMNMQYIYYYYCKLLPEQIKLKAEKEFFRYCTNKPLEYTNLLDIQIIKKNKNFDPYIDVRDYIFRATRNLYEEYLKEDLR